MMYLVIGIGAFIIWRRYRRTIDITVIHSQKIVQANCTEQEVDLRRRYAVAIEKLKDLPDIPV